MRAYIIAAGLALSVIGSARGSVVDTGADGQKSCQFLVEGSFRDTDEARAAGACEGMSETAMVFAPNMPADSRACAPAQGSVLESAKTLLRYLDKNPDRLNESRATVAIAALRDAGLFEGDDATASGRSARKPKKRRSKKPALVLVEAPVFLKQPFRR